MARAAYCPQCGANVYLDEEGRCPKGHDPGALTGHYEVPDEPVVPDEPAPSPPAEVPVVTTPAEAAIADTQVAPKKSPALIVLLVVLGLLVLCGLGSCALAIPLYSTLTEVSSELEDLDLSEGKELFDDESTNSSEDAGDPAAEFVASAQDDAGRMVEWFYPLFEMTHFYYLALPETAESPVEINIVAAYRNNPDFRITFYATRTGEFDPPGFDTDGQSFYDADAGVWWIHPQTRDHALDVLFGPDGWMSESMLDQLAADFVAAHPDKMVTTVSGAMNVALTLEGIDEEEFDDWYDDFTTFESAWELDIASGDWQEVDFREQ